MTRDYLDDRCARVSALDQLKAYTRATLLRSLALKKRVPIPDAISDLTTRVIAELVHEGLALLAEDGTEIYQP